MCLHIYLFFVFHFFVFSKEKHFTHFHLHHEFKKETFVSCAFGFPHSNMVEKKKKRSEKHISTLLLLLFFKNCQKNVKVLFVLQSNRRDGRQIQCVTIYSREAGQTISREEMLDLCCIVYLTALASQGDRFFFKKKVLLNKKNKISNHIAGASRNANFQARRAWWQLGAPTDAAYFNMSIKYPWPVVWEAPHPSWRRAGGQAAVKGSSSAVPGVKVARPARICQRRLGKEAFAQLLRRTPRGSQISLPDPLSASPCDWLPAPRGRRLGGCWISAKNSQTFGLVLKGMVMLVLCDSGSIYQDWKWILMF